MKKYFLLYLLTGFVLIQLSTPGLSARKFELFGYSDFQYKYAKFEGFFSESSARNRTNILMSTEFGKKWDFFLNVEAYGKWEFRDRPASQSESTEPIIPWDVPDKTLDGEIELEELWTSYTFSEKFKIKAGLFKAPFGTFNVFQDAPPAYITVRPPLIYDDEFRGRTPVHIIPDHGNLEVFGAFKINDSRFEYHVYTGTGLGTNSLDFQSSRFNYDTDISNAIGVRLAFNHDENFKFGFSAYFDHAGFKLTESDDDSENLFQPGNPNPYPRSYEESRSLWSFDADATISVFNINGEYFWNHNDSDRYGKYRRNFYYVNFNVEVTNGLKAYFEIDRYSDNNESPRVKYIIGDGILKTIYGLNFKPGWRSAVKAEIQRYSFKNDLNSSYTVFVTGFSLVF